MTCQIHQSIVRRGNHFIRWDKKWILIDGPWKDWLDRQGYVTVIAAFIPPIPCYPYTEPDPYVEYSQLEWQQVRWHPGTIALDIRKVSVELEEKWREWNSKRCRTGWMIKGGALPCYPNRAAPYWDENTQDWWAGE
jgi:hypothetical protein